MYYHFRNQTCINISYLDFKSMPVNKNSKKREECLKVDWWAFIQILYSIYITGFSYIAMWIVQPIIQHFSYIIFHLLGLSLL